MKKILVAMAVALFAAGASVTGVLFVAKDPTGARIELRDEICPFAEYQAQYMTWHTASMSDGDSFVRGWTEDDATARYEMWVAHAIDTNPELDTTSHRHLANQAITKARNSTRAQD